MCHRIISEHQRVRNILKDFASITLRPVVVVRQEIKDLQQRLAAQDLELFPLRADIDIEAYILCAAASTRKFCVDEDNLKIVRFFVPTLALLLLLACTYYYYSL